MSGTNQPAKSHGTHTSLGKRVRDEEGSSSGKILIHIDGQHESVSFRGVPRDLPLQKLLKRYCEDSKLEYQAMRFLYKGQRVLVRRTPDELHLKDGAVINAFVDSHSG